MACRPLICWRNGHVKVVRFAISPLIPYLSTMRKQKPSELGNPDLRTLLKATYGDTGWLARTALAQRVSQRTVSNWTMGRTRLPAWRLHVLLDRLERGDDPIELERRRGYERADRLAEQRKRDREAALMRVRLILRGLAELPGTRILHQADKRFRKPSGSVG